jgi:pyruvate/2-oxoacid:ferredoxin oxidoreductase alpha subunit
VRDSDGTLIITKGILEGGTALTMKEAQRQGRAVLHVRTIDPVPVEMIRAWGEDHDIRVLNVGGPRASEVEGIYDEAKSLLVAFLERLEDAKEPK